MEQQETNSAVTVDISGRQLAHNTLLNLIGRVVPLLVALVTLPYVIRHLGPDRYGLYSLALIVVGYFALFNLGIGPATTKYVAELLGKGEVNKLPELVWTAVASQTCLGLMGGILLAVASSFLVEHVLKIPAGLHPEAHVMFLIMAVALPVDFANGSVQGVLAASQRFDLLNAVGIPSGLLTYLVPVVALALGIGLPAIVFSLVVVRLVASIISLVFAVRLHPALRRIRFDFGLLPSLLRFGGWVTAAGALGPLLLYTDRFVIGAVVSIAAVGYFSVAFSTIYRLQFIPAALTASLMPAFSSLHGTGDISKTTALFVRAHKYIFIVVAPVIFAAIIFAREIFDLWIGGKFAQQAALPFQIIAIGMLVAALAPISGALTQGRSRPDLLFWIYLVELPVNTLFTWFLASRWGVVGAALSFTIRAFAETALLAFIATRACGLELGAFMAPRNLRTLGFLIGATLLVPLGWAVANEPIILKSSTFMSAIAVYIFFFHRYALDPAERVLLRKGFGGGWLRNHQVDVS